MDVVGYETITKTIEHENDSLGDFKVTDLKIKYLDLEGNEQLAEISLYLKED